MANKLDKFGIKFWFAVDFETKHIFNVIFYMGKDKMCAFIEAFCGLLWILPYKKSKCQK